MSQVRTEILTITPTEAKRMLEGNTNNRRLSKIRVRELAEAIRRGDWSLNGESLKFNGKQLLDGQHRLHAVVEANKPIKTLVVWGLNPNVFLTLDQQKRRSVIDALHINGEENTKILASAIALVFDIRRGGDWMRGKARVDNREAMRFLDKEPQIRDSAFENANAEACMARGFAQGERCHPDLPWYPALWHAGPVMVNGR